MRPLLNKITVEVSEELDKKFPNEMHMRATATDKKGNKHIADVLNPLGHHLNPMSVDEICEKFSRLAGPRLGAARVNNAIKLWGNIEKTDDTAVAFDALTRISHEQ
jgi:2-methylcitrate dehydratase PrpD